MRFVHGHVCVCVHARARSHAHTNMPRHCSGHAFTPRIPQPSCHRWSGRGMDCPAMGCRMRMPQSSCTPRNGLCWWTLTNRQERGACSFQGRPRPWGGTSAQRNTAGHSTAQHSRTQQDTIGHWPGTPNALAHSHTPRATPPSFAGPTLAAAAARARRHSEHTAGCRQFHGYGEAAGGEWGAGRSSVHRARFCRGARMAHSRGQAIDSPRACTAVCPLTAGLALCQGGPAARDRGPSRPTGSFAPAAPGEERALG